MHSSCATMKESCNDVSVTSSTPDEAAVWERRLRWYIFTSLVVGVGIVVGEGYTITKMSTSIPVSLGMSNNHLTSFEAPPPPLPSTNILLTDKASYRPAEVQFTWLPAPQGAGVAACDLVVDGFNMQAFEEKAAAHVCLQNRSIVLMGDSVTRYGYGAGHEM